MSPWLIIIVGVVYLYIGIDLMVHDRFGLGLAFLGYAAANAGLYMEAIKP